MHWALVAVLIISLLTLSVIGNGTVMRKYSTTLSSCNNILDLASNFAMFCPDFRTSGWCCSYMWWLCYRSVVWKGIISVLRGEPAAFLLLFISWLSSHTNLHAFVCQHFFAWLRDTVPRNGRQSCFLECRCTRRSTTPRIWRWIWRLWLRGRDHSRSRFWPSFRMHLLEEEDS